MGKQHDEPGNKAGDGAKTALPEQTVDALGRKLKASYDQMLRDPIPDKLMQLLDDLDRSEKGRREAGSGCVEKSAKSGHGTSSESEE